MTRQLLFSECAILREAGVSLDCDLIHSQQVFEEYHSPPRIKRKQWFNTDFVIKLDNWDIKERPKATTVSIRPSTLGVDFFVMRTPSGIPTQLELLEGESIRKDAFDEEIKRVEHAVDAIWTPTREVSVTNAPYLRVARLKQSVVFWLASTTSIQNLLDLVPVRLSSEKSLLEYRKSENDILIDGVLYDSDEIGLTEKEKTCSANKSTRYKYYEPLEEG